MSGFGETLFGGSRFVRWALSPVLLVFAILMPLLVESRTATAVGVLVVMELMCVCLLAGFWLPRAVGKWAFRFLAGIVGVLYGLYAIDGVYLEDGAVRRGNRNCGALLGFLVIGLPSLWFAWKGRFTLRPEPTAAELEAAERAREEELLSPDWSFYEAHLERRVPPALKALYSEGDWVTLSYVGYREPWMIGMFNPLRRESLLKTKDHLGVDIVPIAWSHSGDPIFLRPGKGEADKVYVALHDDPGQVEVLAESVDEMVEKMRAIVRTKEMSE